MIRYQRIIKKGNQPMVAARCRRTRTALRIAANHFITCIFGFNVIARINKSRQNCNVRLLAIRATTEHDYHHDDRNYAEYDGDCE